MSGGEQQMLAVGRGMMLKPRLLMLDEPSLGLAPVMCDVTFEKIDEIHKMGTAILLVEQNVSRALGLVQRAYVLESGSGDHARQQRGTGEQQAGAGGLPRHLEFSRFRIHRVANEVAMRRELVVQAPGAVVVQPGVPIEPGPALTLHFGH